MSAEGGAVHEVTRLDPGEYDHRWPQILPGNRAALLEVLHEQGTVDSGSRGHDVAVGNLETGTKRILIERAGCPKYVSGHVLFGRDGAVYAAPFDPERLELGRPPSSVLEGVAMWSNPSMWGISSGVVEYDIARDGTLLFSLREARLPKRTLVSVDREGRRETRSPSQRAYLNPRFSPDGRRIAVSVQTGVSVFDPFVLDIGSGAWTRVNVEGETPTGPGSERPNFYAAGWMPDGERLLLIATWSRNPGMLLVPIDGSEPPEMFAIERGDPRGLTVAPDGSSVLAARQPQAGDWDIWRVALTGKSAAEPWLATPNWEDNPSFSPTAALSPMSRRIPAVPKSTSAPTSVPP